MQTQGEEQGVGPGIEPTTFWLHHSKNLPGLLIQKKPQKTHKESKHSGSLPVWPDTLVCFSLISTRPLRFFAEQLGSVSAPVISAEKIRAELVCRCRCSIHTL